MGLPARKLLSIDSSSMPPAICPNCGSLVSPKARACPECGSDEETGWSEQGRADRLELPGQDFDYEDFICGEFGDAEAAPGKSRYRWWALAVVIVLAILLLMLW